MSPGPPPTLLALAGLPGTGKSTLARALAAELGAPVLDKDAVRAARFGAAGTDYSRAQDDLCMRLVYEEAARLVRAAAMREATRAATGHAPGATGTPGGAAGVPRVAAILDGRTFSRHESVEALLLAARDAGAALLVVECRCADAIAETRLAADAARGDHPAANRGVALHRTLRAAAEPIETALAPAIAATRGAVAHLVLDTGAEPLAAQVARVREALARLAAR